MLQRTAARVGLVGTGGGAFYTSPRRIARPPTLANAIGYSSGIP